MPTLEVGIGVMDGRKEEAAFHSLSSPVHRVARAVSFLEEPVQYIDISLFGRDYKIVTKTLLPAAANVFISQGILNRLCNDWYSLLSIFLKLYRIQHGSETL